MLDALKQQEACKIQTKIRQKMMIKVSSARKKALDKIKLSKKIWRNVRNMILEKQ